MARDVYAKRPVLTGKATVPPLEIELPDGEKPKPRKVAFKVRVHENGVQSAFDIAGAGIGAHVLTVRFDLDRDGHFDETLRLEWVGDAHTAELGYVPVAAIAVLDGSDEIRF